MCEPSISGASDAGFTVICRSTLLDYVCRTFGVKLESGGPGYDKPSLRGPPVQGLHENARLYSQGSSTPIFSGTLYLILAIIHNSAT